MLNLIVKPYEKRFVFSLILIVLLGYLFWTQSRYPSLDDKALMSGAIQLEDPLSFEAVLPITPDLSFGERVLYSTINWLDTNTYGMAFGVMLGAAFLTMFGYLRQRSFRGGYLNALLGMFVGAPLGVCVNCAAPIAKGLYSSGVRAETALSAMIASPTLNIVVLTLLFSLLPFYMAVAKIALSVFVILIAVPVICRFLPKRQLVIENAVKPEGWDLDEEREALIPAMIRFGKSYLKNLWFIVKTTVPLMIFAGFLGALIATLVPGELLQNVGFNFALVFVVAIIGTFMPVPIAFDVVVAGAFLSLGLDAGYIMALLFTLGSFSVYSFFIVSSTISLRAATLLGLTIVVIGGLAGGGAQLYHNWATQRAFDILLGYEQTPVSSAMPQVG